MNEKVQNNYETKDFDKRRTQVFFNVSRRVSSSGQSVKTIKYSKMLVHRFTTSS